MAWMKKVPADIGEEMLVAGEYRDGALQPGYHLVKCRDHGPSQVTHGRTW